MSIFHELREFERRFPAMEVEELERWKKFWTRHAEGLAPKVRKQAMKRVFEIEKAIRTKTTHESKGAGEGVQILGTALAIRIEPALDATGLFMLALDGSPGPLVWQTSLGAAIIALPSEELAQYLASLSPRRLRNARALISSQACRLPLFGTFKWLLILDSYEVVNAMMNVSTAGKNEVRMVASPWKARGKPS